MADLNFNNFTSASDIAYKAFQEIEGYVNEQATCHKIPTGLKEFDQAILGGIYDTDLMVLAARPSMGITTLALNFLNNIACNEGSSVAYFSFDLSKEVLIKRLLWLMAEIKRKNVSEGWLTMKIGKECLMPLKQYKEVKSFLTILRL